MKTTRLLTVAALFMIAAMLGTTLALTACAQDDAESSPKQDEKQADAQATNTRLLLNPKDKHFQRQAPETYKVKFETSKGDFVLQIHREWAPLGADRFYNLVDAGFYDDVRFFRVIEGFMAQFGINGNPNITDVWSTQKIKDDAVRKSNTRGTISFATSGPDSRTTQVFINFGDNRQLDGMGFSPFGEVIEGMQVVDALHAGYGEGAPRGRGPSQQLLTRQGNEYLNKQFPKLDFVKKAEIVREDAAKTDDQPADE